MKTQAKKIKADDAPKVTREEWMVRSLPFLKERMVAAGGPDFPMPLVSMSLPSKGAFAGKRQRIGECWDKKAAKSGKQSTILISPTLGDPVKILGVLLHECIHSALGSREGHGPAFKKLALAVGLEGKMRATTEGPELVKWLEDLSKKLGTFHHDPLSNYKSPMKKQTTRMRLYVCDTCECKIRKASDNFMALHYCDNDPDARTGMFVLKASPNLEED